MFDSRPPGSLPAARTTLLQHFHGWFVRTARPAFAPGTAELMDFRTPQPADGLSFGYVLPLGRHDALVEYTEFSPPLTRDAYEAAVRHYTDDVLRLGDLEVLSTETGVIPMTDAVLPRRTGQSVFRIGAAGGATRPSTGYTFAGLQRQTRAVAAALRAGRRPVPPPAHSARSRAMDAVLLRALAGRPRRRTRPVLPPVRPRPHAAAAAVPRRRHPPPRGPRRRPARAGRPDAPLRARTARPAPPPLRRPPRP